MKVYLYLLLMVCILLVTSCTGTKQSTKSKLDDKYSSKATENKNEYPSLSLSNSATSAVVILKGWDVEKKYEQGIKKCNKELPKYSGWPNYLAIFHHCRAVFLTKLARHDEASEDIKNVIALDPKFYTESKLKTYEVFKNSYKSGVKKKIPEFLGKIDKQSLVFDLLRAFTTPR